jgi:hypothetical protein
MPSSEEPTFEQALEKVEKSLANLKERYAQIQGDQEQQSVLQHRREEIRTQLRQAKSATLKLELQEIEQQLEDLEVKLESRLFSWRGLTEVFWQAVRFGGLGIAIGWSLAFFTIKNPVPQSSQPNNQSIAR